MSRAGKRGVGFETFKQHFASDEDCARFLCEARLGPDYRCRSCNAIGGLKLWKSTGQCRCSNCQNTYSARRETMFDGTKLPLSVWFEAMWLMTITRKSLPHGFFADYFGISRDAAWRMAMRIRAHMAALCERGMLGGEGRIVFIDDTDFRCITRRGYRKAHKAIVVAMWDGRRVVTEIVPRRREEIMLQLVRRHVVKGSTIVSNGQSSFRSLGRSAYRDLRSLSTGELAPELERKARYLDAYWINIKKSLLGAHRHLGEKHLRFHIKEHELRHYFRGRPAEMFWEMVSNYPPLALPGSLRARRYENGRRVEVPETVSA